MGRIDLLVNKIKERNVTTTTSRNFGPVTRFFGRPARGTLNMCKSGHIISFFSEMDYMNE